MECIYIYISSLSAIIPTTTKENGDEKKLNQVKYKRNILYKNSSYIV